VYSNSGLGEFRTRVEKNSVLFAHMPEPDFSFYGGRAGWKRTVFFSHMCWSNKFNIERGIISPLPLPPTTLSHQGS
jgi:hypothetical protein